MTRTFEDCEAARRGCPKREFLLNASALIIAYTVRREEVVDVVEEAKYQVTVSARFIRASFSWQNSIHRMCVMTSNTLTNRHARTHKN